MNYVENPRLNDSVGRYVPIVSMSFKKAHRSLRFNLMLEWRETFYMSYWGKYN